VNCSSSVEPFSAAVEDFPLEMISCNRSKYPVPTNFWCLTAVYPACSRSNSYCCIREWAAMPSCLLPDAKSNMERFNA
jgi:hypothetical protein